MADKQANAVNIVVTHGGGSEMMSVSPTKNNTKNSVTTEIANNTY